MKVPFDYDNLAIFSDDERFAPLCEPSLCVHMCLQAEQKGYRCYHSHYNLAIFLMTNGLPLIVHMCLQAEQKGYRWVLSVASQTHSPDNTSKSSLGPVTSSACGERYTSLYFTGAASNMWRICNEYFLAIKGEEALLAWALEL